MRRMALVGRLRYEAQNNEMIDQYFTDAGKLMNEAADALAASQEDLGDIRGAWRALLSEYTASQGRVRKYDGLLRRTANMLRTAPPRERHILGIGGDGVTHWYIADQLLADIDEALIG